ncbi:MAG: heavy-metal-associated domain-containing protein [Bacillota bacterium]|jgi:copper chaperone
MTTKTFQLETLSCPTCAAKIDSMLKKTEGVQEAEVLFNSSRVKVTFDDKVTNSDMIKSKIAQLGFEVLGEK